MPENEPKTSLRVGSPPAPDDLALVEGFLNTWSDELDIEDFETAKSTDDWLRVAGLWAGTKITSKQHQEILQFRDALRAWVLDYENYQPLNELLSGAAFRPEFGIAGDVLFRPLRNTDRGVLSALTVIISESQRNGTWDRFKCCELPTCGWAFYDSTRSRTKRWCSMKTCGSRHKAREYYKRKR